MTYFLRPLFVVIGLLAALVGACAQPSLSVAEYAASLEDGTESYISEAQELSGTFQKTVEDEIGALAEDGSGDLLLRATRLTSRETVQYLALLEDAMMRYRVSVESLSPPSTLAERHNAYIQAIESVQSSMQGTRDAVGKAGDLDGIQVAITSSGFGDGQLRLRAACISLEAAVRAEGRGLDLGCIRPTGVAARP